MVAANCIVSSKLVKFLVLLYLVAASSELKALVHGQLADDSPGGFISIDCGVAANRTYTDESPSRLRYVSDAGFTDAGLNAGVGKQYDYPDLAEQYRTARYFPIDAGGGGGAAARRSCYTLRPVAPGGKYLVRATFYYGNYDELYRLPAFDLHLGTNRWATVNVTAVDGLYILEAVAVSPSHFLQVCLVNTGSGTPFISGLELRPLKATKYPEATANQSLLLLSHSQPSATFGFNRYQFWPDGYPLFRYPFDPYDRLWQRYDNGDSSWTNITTSATVEVSNASSSFDKPSVVLQSAATPVNTTRIEFRWLPDPALHSKSNSSSYLLLLYFAELQRLPSGSLRQFDILVDGVTWDGSRRFTPKYLSAEVVKRWVQGSSGQHAFSLVATANATLPPVLNAFEIYSVQPMTEIMTDDADATAMITIRMTYSLKKNWMGDPCAPKEFAWAGLNCSYSSSGPARITAVHLSSSMLTGALDSSFGDLKSLRYLDLSNNSLSGYVPDFLVQMPSLTFLDLSSNKFRGSVPAVLLEKHRKGSLDLRMANNPDLCDNGASTCESKNKKHNKTILIATIIPIAVTLFVASVYILYRMRKKRVIDRWMENKSRFSSPQDRMNVGVFESREFTYTEIKLMTANFREQIGQGGFGPVFLGYLENGSPVAIKMRSKTSSQGDKEFLAEAQHLTRVHHRNLVSLIRYCKDKKHLAIVYEYMHGGSLEDHLRGEASNATPLTWHQRLKIALDSGQGLEYLHKSCQPPLIHRDLKPKNILLSANLKAKIADFGLTEALHDESTTHVTIHPAGTLGYLDPEYYNTSQLSEKSDVYSFGVVLLELITGQPPAVSISDTESIHTAHWVREKLLEGDIATIADPMMDGEYEVNSVWKVAELALKCQKQPSRERPTMTDIVAELKESLELEVSYAMGYYSSAPSSTLDLSATSVDLHIDAQPSVDLHIQAVPELQHVGIAS